MVRGRKPKASAVKRANGAYVKDPQRENHREPKVKNKAPTVTPLVKTDKEAHKKWKQVVKLLTEMKVISTADQDLIEAYCLAYSEFVLHVKAIRKEGFIVEGRNGLVRNPRLPSVKSLREYLSKILAEMGLTPSARSRLQVVFSDETDVFSELMKRRNTLN